MLTVVDVFSREALAIEVGQRPRGERGPNQGKPSDPDAMRHIPG